MTGFFRQEGYIIYAGVSKKIYLGDWEGIYFAGDSIESFLDNIFTKEYEPEKYTSYQEDYYKKFTIS